MATAASKTRCLICGKEKATYKCEGCLQNYCKTHLLDHQRELEQQLDEIEHERNIFRQTLSEHEIEPHKHLLVQQVTQWERRSIEKIEQTAKDARKVILNRTKEYHSEIDVKLNALTEEIKDLRRENDFNETNLDELKHKLTKLEQQLNQPSNISLTEDNSSSFIPRIRVIATREAPDVPVAAKWKQAATTIAGGNGKGAELRQFNIPWGIDIDEEETIYVADTGNHRVVAWEKGATHGQVVAGGNGEGNGNHQLNQPTKVLVDDVNDCLLIADWGNKRVVRWPLHNGTSGETIIEGVTCVGLLLDQKGYLYVSDEGKDEVRRWKIGEREGTLVAGGNGKGSRLDQLHGPRFLSSDQNDTLYVSDVWNHRVVKWNRGAREGLIVAGGQGQGNSLGQLSGPIGIIVDKSGTLYVADSLNDRVVRWKEGAKEGGIIAGENGEGDELHQLNVLVDLVFDEKNNLYVLDKNNSRVQKFCIDRET